MKERINCHKRFVNMIEEMKLESGFENSAESDTTWPGRNRLEGVCTMVQSRDIGHRLGRS